MKNEQNIIVRNTQVDFFFLVVDVRGSIDSNESVINIRSRAWVLRGIPYKKIDYVNYVQAAVVRGDILKNLAYVLRVCVGSVLRPTQGREKKISFLNER